MKFAKSESYFFLLLLFLALGLTVAIFLPYLKVLVLAFVLGVLFYPVHRRLLKIFKFKNLAALVSTMIVCLAVLLPAGFLGWQIFLEASGLFHSLSSGQAGWESLIVKANDVLDLGFVNQLVSPEQIDQAVRAAAGWIAGNLGGFFTASVGVIISFFFLLISVFYVFRDGQKFKEWFVKSSPLSTHRENQILDKLGLAINSILRGQIIIVLLQGLATSIGFLIFGVPNPFLWGLVAAIMAFIPSLGTSLVNLPAVLYLVINQQYGLAIGLGIWAFTAVGMIDNLLGPKLIGSGAKLHSLFVLFSVLGGISLFGPLGFIYGPLILSFFVVLLSIYKDLNNSERDS